jgi:hypothetical protein
MVQGNLRFPGGWLKGIFNHLIRLFIVLMVERPAPTFLSRGDHSRVGIAFFSEERHGL